MPLLLERTNRPMSHADSVKEREQDRRFGRSPRVIQWVTCVQLPKKGRGTRTGPLCVGLVLNPGEGATPQGDLLQESVSDTRMARLAFHGCSLP